MARIRRFPVAVTLLIVMIVVAVASVTAYMVMVGRKYQVTLMDYSLTGDSVLQVEVDKW